MKCSLLGLIVTLLVVGCQSRSSRTSSGESVDLADADGGDTLVGCCSKVPCRSRKPRLVTRYSNNQLIPFSVNIDDLDRRFIFQVLA